MVNSHSFGAVSALISAFFSPAAHISLREFTPCLQLISSLRAADFVGSFYLLYSSFCMRIVRRLQLFAQSVSIECSVLWLLLSAMARECTVLFLSARSVADSSINAKCPARHIHRAGQCRISLRGRTTYKYRRNPDSPHEQNPDRSQCSFLQ